jgi:hypothetical protein
LSKSELQRFTNSNDKRTLPLAIKFVTRYYNVESFLYEARCT